MKALLAATGVLIGSTLWSGNCVAGPNPKDPELKGPALAQQPSSLWHLGPAAPITEGRPALRQPQIGKWSLSVDPLALGMPSSSTRSSQSGFDPAVGQEFSFVLPGEGRKHAVVEKVSELVADVTTVEGRLLDDGQSSFAFSFEHGDLLGVIETHETTWVVQPTGNGGHSLTAVDRSAVMQHKEDVLGERSPEPRNKSYGAKTGGSGRVDILFLHASNVSNASTLAGQIVARYNTALSNSLVSSNNYIVSAGVEQVNSTFDDMTRQQILDAMVDRAAPFEDLVSDLMFEANADAVFLIVSEDTWYIPPPIDFWWTRLGGAVPGSFGPENPFALSTESYVLWDNTAAHELGHLFGGKHEDKTGSERPKIYSTGTYPTGPWMTMMGGYVDPNCAFVAEPGTPNCKRISYFSNPAVSYEGVSTGTVGSADMESWLETEMVAASSWRDDGDPAAPGPSSSISNAPQYCWGYNQVSWASSSGATEYRLYQSSSSSFTNPTIVYEGSSTFKLVNVPASSTRYYRVRACDDDGCSNYSAQAYASYYSGCM